MAGNTPDGPPVVSEVRIYEKSKAVEVTFANGTSDRWGGGDNYSAAVVAVANLTKVSGRDLQLVSEKGFATTIVLTPSVRVVKLDQ